MLLQRHGPTMFCHDTAFFMMEAALGKNGRLLFDEI